MSEEGGEAAGKRGESVECGSASAREGQRARERDRGRDLSVCKLRDEAGIALDLVPLCRHSTRQTSNDVDVCVSAHVRVCVCTCVRAVVSVVRVCGVRAHRPGRARVEG